MQVAGDASATTVPPALPPPLELVDRWWRAANYLSVGQIYLLDNPMLRRPLVAGDAKPRLIGHWGTTPGLNFVYAHLNRVIRARGLDVVFVVGPGHGGPAAVANAYLDGTYSEVYPHIGRDEEGMRRLFRQFSFPGGIPSHVAPETPGSIHEGGELGYSLAHSFGAAFDNPGLIVCCVVGDGEAETGPLATGWHGNKFLDPAADGAVLPVLHLNGYKIANPTVLARIGDDELESLLCGYGYHVHWVSGDDPVALHPRMAATLDVVVDEILAIQTAARAPGAPGTSDDAGARSRPRWPMIVLRTPKGWTGPKTVDGKPTEGSWRSHQVPLADVRTDPSHLALLESWMRSYRPDELFDDHGVPMADLADLVPVGDGRMSANPNANGGLRLRDLELPDFGDYAVDVPTPGTTTSEATRVLGAYLRDVIAANPRQFRLFGPDETASNRLDAVYETTDKQWEAEVLPTDEHLARHGQVMEVLSEHQCQGWLEGYLLTGRHGMFNCYEAFIHIVDSMFNQHAKWLKTTRHIPWRRPVASLNYLLSSHVWRQDNNGFSHQDPGFIDHVVNKKAEVIRVYLPPDANCLLSVADHCLRSRHYVNVIVAGKQPSLDYLSVEDAVLHCTRGLGIWEWASNDDGDPDVVLACCGDIPTLEVLAATDIIRGRLPELKVRVVNVVDLMRLQPDSEHPHGLSDREFDTVFTPDRPVVFAYHGYPWLIHRLTYRRTNHDNLHVRGYKEEGTTTTPFDMVMLNDLDRFHLVMDVIDRVPNLGSHAAALREDMVDARARARAYTRAEGEDPPDIAHWVWPAWIAPAAVRILVVNAGSSSIKLSVLGDGDDLVGTDLLDTAGDEPGGPRATAGLRALLGRVGPVDAVGHRFVHGGTEFRQPVRIDDGVRQRLAALLDLAPLHQQRSLDGLRMVDDVLGASGTGPAPAHRSASATVEQVACFDTAFHADMPAAAVTYALPASWRSRWPLRRFGFHGLSHAYAARKLLTLHPAPRPDLRIVSCHLGAGASLCAIAGERSVDTTMGFTPLEGLVMATRSGSVDPGLVLWLQRHGGLSVDEVDDGLEHASGLLGLAGDADMRSVLAACLAGEGDATLAVDVYVHRLAAGIAAMAAALGGLDALVFTAGVGEHAPTVRSAVAARLGFLGVVLDAAANAAGDTDRDISAHDAPVRSFVIEAREDLEIARGVRAVLNAR